MTLKPLYLKKSGQWNKFESVGVRWMNLETAIQSEVRKRKNKYNMGSRKTVLMNLFAGKEWRCRCREQTCGNSGGRRGQDELRKQHACARAHTHPHTRARTVSCAKQIATGKLLYNTGSPAWGSVTTQKGAVAGKRETQEGGERYTYNYG